MRPMTGEPRGAKQRVDAGGVRCGEAPGVREAARLVLLVMAVVPVAAAILINRFTPEAIAASDVAVPPAPRPTARLKAGGIRVFPPPGTKPIKRGIIVPEDFALPPGYVRHYQATDDGERLPAILMFHPDYEFVDAQGRPVSLPEDRLVPPDMAPPGLRIEMLQVPEKRGALDPRP